MPEVTRKNKNSSKPEKPRLFFQASRRSNVILVVVFLSMVVVFFAFRWIPNHEDALQPPDASDLIQTTYQPQTPRDVPDPKLDGWSSEALSSEADSQLKRLAQILAEPAKVKPGSIDEISDNRFSCGKLVPDSLQTVFEEKYLTVERATFDTELKDSPADISYRDTSGFSQALAQLLASLRGAKNLHAKFKLIHLDITDEAHFTTRQFFSLSGRTTTGMIEQNATWKIRWGRLSPEALPKILLIRLEAFEQVTTNNPTGPFFVDCTEAVLGSNPSFRRQMQLGNTHWSRRIESHHHFYLFGHHGLAIGDVNGDELDDVYRCQAGGLPNRLYLQQPDATAKDVSKQAGVDYLDNTRSALFVDLDNDGDQDLVLALSDAILMLENDGSGNFSRRVRIPDVHHGYSLSAADYDLDGRLDIYVCVYYATGKVASKFPVPVPYFNANNGGKNFLFKNNGNWQFTDVTSETGLDQNNHRFSYAATWEDYDNDGDVDLYVANDFGRNHLFRNDQGRFTDVAAEAGLEDGAFGMSVSFADYNRDGLMDIYVGNMFSAAGNRITHQKKFKPNVSPSTRAMYQRLTRGNTLFQNIGGGKFQDTSAQAGVMMGRWAWSSIFADINNDGWEDLLVANGFLTGEDNQDL